MKKITFFLLLLKVCFAADEFLDSSNLKTGDKLTSVTRMARNEKVHFDLEVLSVLRHSRPGEDAILAEIKTPLFQETGVLAGMSGSPVYYNEKLVGAVAFTSSFMKKPIVGITPIKSMLRLIDYSQVERKNPYQEAKKMYGLDPISTPLMVSGNISLNSRVMKDLLGDWGFNPVPGGVQTQVSSEVATKLSTSVFEPGDACAVNLVSGDMNLTAIGTVTYVSNDYVLAFGHPMDLKGSTRLPLHTAVVDAVVPLMTVSYKVGSIGKEVGAVTEDRSPAILGKIGEVAPKVPVKVFLNTPLQKKQLNYEVVQETSYFADLLGMIFINSFIQFESLTEEATFFYQFKIKTDFQGKEIVISDKITVRQGVSGMVALAQSISGIVKYLDNNSFLPIKVEDVELEVGLYNSIEYFQIEQLTYDQAEYFPGDDVAFTVHFKNHRQKKMKETFMFSLPKSLRPGVHPIGVSSGNSFLSLDAAMSPEKYFPRTPSRIFEILNSEIDSKTLSIYMLADSPSIMVEGEQYKRLPLLMRDTLSRTRSTDRSNLIDFHYKDFAMDQLVLGERFIRIKVLDPMYKKAARE